jgi:hypothetical protein
MHCAKNGRMREKNTIQKEGHRFYKGLQRSTLQNTALILSK